LARVGSNPPYTKVSQAGLDPPGLGQHTVTPLWTSAAADLAVGAVSTVAWQANGVSIDTRTLQPGDLFVALKADRDGHDFVGAALAKGAAAALVTHRPTDVPADTPLLIVPDVQLALEALGRAARARTKARICAITGSVGKTSTKEMLRAALAHQGKTHAAEASYNNHWGVPLTLARMPADADYAVFEIGMNHPGEIAPLAKQVRPHVALVTIVAAAHLEAFANIDGIADEKASIFQGLVPGGTAILNGDLPTSPILLAAAQHVTTHVITFGTKPGNHHRVSDISVHDGATVGRARAWRTPMLLKIRSEGKHFLINALGVIAAAQAMGADRALSLLGLAEWSPPPGRGTREALVLGKAQPGETLDLIDDAFNANPTSLSAALEVLANTTPKNGIGRVSRGRRVAILGDMLELGPDEIALHAAMARDRAIRVIDIVHCAGPRMRALYEALPEEKRGLWFPAADDLAAMAGRLIDAGDVVLVKGSKGSYIARVVDAIRKLGHRAATSEAEG
jgi:UDP-N-acetylmuramoyl-tripeptide--D-alanyl-D-alanine ligase